MSFRTFSFLQCLFLLSLSVSIFFNRSLDDQLSRFFVSLLQPPIERPSCESSLLLLASNLTSRSSVGLVLRSGLPVGLPHQRMYKNHFLILVLLVLASSWARSGSGAWLGSFSWQGKQVFAMFLMSRFMNGHQINFCALASIFSVCWCIASSRFR